MDYERERKEIGATRGALQSYDDAAWKRSMWDTMPGDIGDRSRLIADAEARVAETYALLLRAALDLFEDGDLFDKYRTACQDAGIEVES